MDGFDRVPHMGKRDLLRIRYEIGESGRIEMEVPINERRVVRRLILKVAEDNHEKKPCQSPFPSVSSSFGSSRG